MCQTVPIWLGPRRSRFISLSILPSSFILSISVSAPVKQNQQVMSCRIGKTQLRGLKKSAEELRMGIPALRQYIDATMPVAPIGNGVQICSVYNFQILFRGFFFMFTAHRLMTQDDQVRQQAKRVIKKKKNIDLMGSVSPIRQAIAYSFCFTGAETEIHKIKDDSKINREKNIDRRGQRHIVNVWLTDYL